MLRRALLAILPLVGSLPAFAHPPRQPDKAESQSLVEEIKIVRDRIARAVAGKDATTLRAIYADAYTHTDSSGKVHDKAARIAAAMAGEPLIETAPASDLSYRVFAGPTIVVTGTSTIRDTAARWVCVYVTGRDGWLLAVSQATRLPS